jgi:upstream activation factor subunit UAF30
MVRTSKSTTTPVTPVATPVVKENKPKKVKAPKEEVAPVVAPVVESSELPSDVSSLTAKLIEYGAKIQQVSAAVSSLKSEYKLVEKLIARELKNAQKASKKKRSSGNKKPSGFIKPTKISDELAIFLGKEIGTELSRTDVSKEIKLYIDSHKLQDPVNGRNILADAKLAKLLKLTKEDNLSYFNLQRFMKIHFIKAVPPTVSA